jgi:hypothetical protein
LGWICLSSATFSSAIGPRHTLAHLQRPPNGNFIADFVSHLISWWREQTGLHAQHHSDRSHCFISILSLRQAALYLFARWSAPHPLRSTILCHRSLRRSGVGRRVQPHRSSTLPLVEVAAAGEERLDETDYLHEIDRKMRLL